MMEIFATEARRLKLHGIPHSRKREKKKKKINHAQDVKFFPVRGGMGRGGGRGEQFPFLTCQEKSKAYIVRGRASGDPPKNQTL